MPTLPGKVRCSVSRTLKLLAFFGNSSVGSLMSVKRWMLLMMKMLVGGCVVLFYSHWATFCLLRGTRPTKE